MEPQLTGSCWDSTDRELLGLDHRPSGTRHGISRSPGLSISGSEFEAEQLHSAEGQVQLLLGQHPGVSDFLDNPAMS